MGTSPSQVDLSPPHQLAKLFGCGSRDYLVDPVLSVGLKLQGCAFCIQFNLFFLLELIFKWSACQKKYIWGSVYREDAVQKVL